MRERLLRGRDRSVRAPASSGDRGPIAPTQQRGSTGHDFAKIDVFDRSAQRDETNVVRPVPSVEDLRAIEPPTAIGFVPDHAFFELLAHEVAYSNKLELQYLYRRSEGLDSTTPASTDFPDGFALSPVPPTFSIPNLPLVYRIESVPNTDPLNEKLGLAAFMLTPVTRDDAPRILLFRGTEPALADVFADADREGPGSVGFEALREELAWTLIKFAVSGGPVVVTGHSLGGSLAQLAAAAAPGLVTECVTFNSPGIGARAVGEFASNVVAAGEAPQVTHYVTRGDIVSTAGQTRLPGQTNMFDNEATRLLARFYDDEKAIAFASDGIFRLYKVIQTFADRGLDTISVVHALWAGATLGDEMAALSELGCILGELHSNRPLKGSVPLGNSAPVGSTWQSYPPTEQTSIGSMEAARLALSSALSGATANLALIPLQLVSYPPGTVKAAAQLLEPIVDALVTAILIAGGLKGLLGLMLYVDPTTHQIHYWLHDVVIKPH